MPRRRKSKARRRRKPNFPFLFCEAHHGRLVPATTLSMPIPSDLPKYRNFRPHHISLFFAPVRTPAIVQVNMFGPDGNQVMSTGPITVPMNGRKVRINYPRSSPPWSDSSRNSTTTPLMASVDNLCVTASPGTDYSVIYSGRSFINYGEEEQSESCPKFWSNEGDGDFEGPSLRQSFVTLSI